MRYRIEDPGREHDLLENFSTCGCGMVPFRVATMPHTFCKNKKQKFMENTRQHRRIFRGCASVLNAGRAGSRPHEARVHSFSKPLTDTRKTLTYKQNPKRNEKTLTYKRNPNRHEKNPNRHEKNPNLHAKP